MPVLEGDAVVVGSGSVVPDVSLGASDEVSGEATPSVADDADSDGEAEEVTVAGALVV